jgi:hypothetical protein
VVEPHCQVRTRSWFEYSVYRLGAEREGFEPPVPEGTLHFECSVVIIITIVYNECVKIIQNIKGLPC